LKQIKETVLLLSKCKIRIKNHEKNTKTPRRFESQLINQSQKLPPNYFFYFPEFFSVTKHPVINENQLIGTFIFNKITKKKPQKT